MQLKITYAFLIVFTVWFLVLYNRIFDKQLKKYILGIGILQIFWMITRITRGITYGTLKTLTWYAYYIPMIFMPTFYYFSSKYITNRIVKYKKTDIIISTILVTLVLTNESHHIVFSELDADGEYYHKIGYYIICLWIFYQLIMSTTILVKNQIKLKKHYKVLVPFIPIVLALVYTVLYIMKISLIQTTNMSVILGTLFFLGIECVLNLDLIPNNLNYVIPYKKSNLKKAIISKDTKTILKTQAHIEIPEEIIDDMKNGKIKAKYKRDNDVYITKQIVGGVSILQKSFKEINELKRISLEKNDELKKQKDLLENKQKIMQELYEIKIRNQIIDEVAEKIETRKQEIERILSKMQNVEREKLATIKLLIGYCKRMSNLVISNYNEETYNKEKINLLINELFQDASSFNISGILINNDINECSSEIILKIYDSIFAVIENINNTNIIVSIVQNNGYTEIIINVEKNTKNLSKELIKKCEDCILDVEEKKTEEGTKISYKINS